MSDAAAKVWGVSTGSYSDYGVHCIFTTEEAANAYAEQMNRTGGGELGRDGDVVPVGTGWFVEEFALNTPTPPAPKVWVAQLRLDSPWSFSTGFAAHLTGGDEYERASPDGDGNAYLVEEDFLKRWSRRIVLFRPTAEHAARAAREMWRAIEAGTVLPDALPWVRVPLPDFTKGRPPKIPPKAP